MIKKIAILCIASLLLCSCAKKETSESKVPAEEKTETSIMNEETAALNNEEIEEIRKTVRDEVGNTINEKLENFDIDDETKQGIIDDITAVVTKNTEEAIKGKLDTMIANKVSSAVNAKVEQAMNETLSAAIDSKVGAAVAQINPTVTYVTNQVVDDTPDNVTDGTAIACDPAGEFDWQVTTSDGNSYNVHVNSFSASISNRTFDGSKDSSFGYSKYIVNIRISGYTDAALSGYELGFSMHYDSQFVGNPASCNVNSDGSFNVAGEIYLNSVPDCIHFSNVKVNNLQR